MISRLYIFPIADNMVVSMLHVHRKMFSVDEFAVVGKKNLKVLKL